MPLLLRAVHKILLHFFFCAAVFLGTSGCTFERFDRLGMMPTPVHFSEAKRDEFAQKNYLKKSPYQGLLYVTDRQPSKETGSQRFYSNARGSLMRAGICEVKYSDSLLGENLLRLLPIAGERVKPYPGRVTQVNELGYLSKVMPYGDLTGREETKGLAKADSQFATLINQKLATSGQKDVFVFVHGFRVVFENPLLASAELWNFMGNDGAVIAYAWPSTPNYFAYLHDIETARISGRNLRKFVKYLSQNTKARKIHIIAHSAGTRMTMTALNELSLSSRGENLRLGQVALIASDYDPQQFASALGDGVLDILDDLTVYLSRDDFALGLAKRIFSLNRLGQVDELASVSPNANNWLRNHPKLHFVDVSQAKGAFSGNGHSYHRNSPWVSGDLLTTMTKGLKPQERGLVRRKGQIEWVFPPDYVERVKRVGP